jgi:hypothetical protein
MATVKTKLTDGELRIITKVVNGQRRVSCSCCPSEEGCCMYPADQLGVGYTANDLPDQIEVREPTVLGPNPAIFNKNGAEYEHFSQSSTEKVFVDVDSNGKPIWKFQSVDSGEITIEGPLSPNDPYCLITEIDVVGFQGAGDLFADTYQFDLSFSSNQRERVALCVWGGAASGYLAYYDGNDSFVKLFYNGPPHKWVYIVENLAQDEDGGVWEKDDPQNGPAGTYSPSTNVTSNFYAGQGTLIVSES